MRSPLCYFSSSLLYVIILLIKNFFYEFIPGFGKIVLVGGAGRINDQYYWTEFAKRGRKRDGRN